MGDGSHAPLISEREVVELIKRLPATSFLRQWVIYGSRISDAHLAYHVGVGLGLLSQTLPPDTGVPFAGGKVYGNVYIMAVGDSTMSRKNAALNAGQTTLELALPNNVGEIPGSPEGLLDSLREKPQQILFWQEIAAMFAQAQRGYMEPMKARLTEAYDALTLGRRRANERGKPTKSEPIRNTRLSIVAATTPDFYEKHLEEVDLRAGFTSRFLHLKAGRERLVHRPPELPEEKHRLAMWLKEITEPWYGLQRTPGQCAGFDDAAGRRWDRWQEDLDRLVRSAPNANWAAGVARATTHALKVALLLAWDFGGGRESSDSEWYITDPVLDVTLKIIEWHIRSVQDIVLTLAPDRDMRDRRRVLNAIRSMPRPFGEVIREAQVTSRRGKELIQTLLDEGVIMSLNIEGSPGSNYALANGGAGRLLLEPTPLADPPLIVSPPTNPTALDDEEDDAGPTPLD